MDGNAGIYRDTTQTLGDRDRHIRSAIGLQLRHRSGVNLIGGNHSCLEQVEEYWTTSLIKSLVWKG